MGDDGVTSAQLCACGRLFVAVGRQLHCSASCRQRAYRARRRGLLPEAALTRRPRAQTVYECPRCEERLLGEQRCPDCQVFCLRVGPGGCCPRCDVPVALADLVDLSA